MKLQKVLEEIPENFKYSGYNFNMISFSWNIFKTKRYPTRSKEIRYTNKSGSREVYIYENEIYYFKNS